MAPSDAALAETAIEAVVALDGSFRREGRRERPHLVLAGDHLYLTDAPWLDTRFRVDALREGVEYRRGRLHDRLAIGGRKLGVPRGEGARARRMIALARVRATGGGHGAIPKAGVYLEAIGDLEKEWLVRHLGRDEVLLAWLHTTETWSVRSEPTSSKEKVTPSFFLTSARAGLVAITELGDVRATTLPSTRLDVRRHVARDVVHAGAERFRATLKNSRLFTEVAALPALPPEARVYEVAQATFAARHRDRHLDEVAMDLLHHGKSLGDPRARLANEALSDRSQDDLDDAIRTLERANDSTSFGRSLVEILKTWELSTIRAHRLLEAVERASGDVGARLVLHRAVREKEIAQTRDLGERTEHDLVLARALHTAGSHGEAMRVLRDRLATLPDPALLDLIPHPDDRGTAPPIRARVKLLDAIAGVAPEPEARVTAIVDVAQLEPLDPRRLEAVVESAAPALAARASAARRAILPGGLVPGAPPTAWPSVRPLGPAELERLRHPLARAEGALAKLQALLASVEAPDHESLRAYCDRLRPEASAEAAAAQDALTDATILLGARSAEAYISRGERSVGVRAYEGRPPFLLVGGDHLLRESEWALAPNELRFAIGEEVAHLRFGHARVTTTALWSGILEKSKTAVDMLIGALPLFRSLKFAGKLGDVTGYLRDAQIIRAIDTAQRLVVDAASGDGGPEDVLAAHRVMQLTADRAGLLLSRDLAASIRAMFRLWRGYAPELPVAERAGLRVAVARRDDEQRLLHAELAVRTCALLGFYLDDDYRALDQAAFDAPAAS